MNLEGIKRSFFTSCPECCSADAVACNMEFTQWDMYMTFSSCLECGKTFEARKYKSLTSIKDDFVWGRDVSI